MKEITSIAFSLFLLSLSFLSFGQEGPVHPDITGTGTYHGLSDPLSELPVLTDGEFQLMMIEGKIKAWNQGLDTRQYPFTETALPKGPDEAWQKQMGTIPNTKSPSLNFSGQTSAYFPSDANGTAGPSYYMQTINSVYAIYDKTDGSLEAGPTNMNLLFSGVTGANCNDGDPLILYDEAANRWLAVEFSICGSNHYMLVAVSQTNDPTGSWHRYSFDVDDMPDYEKFGIWHDGYYMGTNNSSGKDIYAFQRSAMLTGGSPQFIGFNNPWRPSTIDGFHCVPPLDNDGNPAPGSVPGMFITLNDDAISGGSDELWIYELDVNWSVPANSTFDRVQQLSVTPFDSNFGNSWDNIPQQGTGQKLDAIPMIIMNRPQYRNFGSYETIVCCHTVDVNGTNHAGIRWYELRRTSGNWFVRQTGTYAPDSHSRWMGSIALNGSEEIALGYSISSTSMYPGIRYCGQSSSAYAAGNGILDIGEQVIQNATNAQTGFNRWGDYANMAVDPDDDHTFWFTTQYGGQRQTKIAAFEFEPVGLNAGFSGTPQTVCEGGQVTFTNTSSGGANNWAWSFPGGSPSTFNGPNPPPITYNTIGTFDVSLEIGDGNTSDTETKQDYITVTDIYADFSATSTAIFVGQAANFSDNSGCDPQSWQWSFQGGTPATFSGQQPPPIEYSTIGTFDVTLTVTNQSGSDTKTMNDYITVTEVEYCTSSGSADYEWIASVDINGQVKASGSSGSTGYQDFTGFTFNLFSGTQHDLILTPGFPFKNNFQFWRIWIDFNRNGQFTDAGEMVFAADNRKDVVSGTFDIPAGPDITTTMRVSMKRGTAPTSCESFDHGEVEDYTVTISEPVPLAPVAEFAANTTSISPGGTVTFSDLSANGPATWSWTFEGGTPNSSNEENPVVSYPQAGTFDVTLTATNAIGSNTKTKTDYIQVAEFQPPPFCEPLYVNNGSIYINSLTIGTTASPTGPGEGGYVFYDDPVFLLAPGQQYSVNVLPSNAFNPYYMKVWIDFNNDDDFFDWNETVLDQKNTVGSLDEIIFIPLYAEGTVRLRASLKTGDMLYPCDDGFMGEVEDYWVTFMEQDTLPDPSGSNQVTVFPNPLDGEHLHIRIPGLQVTARVSVFSADGTLVREGRIGKEEITINTTFMKNGVYYIKIAIGNDVHLRKVVRM